MCERKLRFSLAADESYLYTASTQGRGRSSGVERYLAKVNVVSSNLIARSKFSKFGYKSCQMIHLR